MERSDARGDRPAHGDRSSTSISSSPPKNGRRCARSAHALCRNRPAAPPVPVAAMVDEKLHCRRTAMAIATRACRRCATLGGARSRRIDAEAKSRYGGASMSSARHGRTTCSQRCKTASVLAHSCGGTCPPSCFLRSGSSTTLSAAYYAHPTAWSEIGFGGPASPRGYVRMNFDRRDPWEAAEAQPGEEEKARRENARVG